MHPLIGAEWLRGAGIVVLWNVIAVVLSTAVATAAPPNLVEEGCPVTLATAEQAPPSLPSSGAGERMRSPDGLIWVAKDQRWFAGGVKVPWTRPAGTRLEISGTRLDGPAPPLLATVPDGYDGEFQATGLDFPAGGCWEVEARAAGSTLRFVAEVLPRSFRPAAVGCADHNAVVTGSNAVLLADAESAQAAGSGFAYWTMRARQVWRGSMSAEDRFEILQETDEPTFQPGQTYLLYLESRPGTPWRAICPSRTLGILVGDRLQPVQATGSVVWAGMTPDEIAAAVRAVGTSEPAGSPRPGASGR